MKRLVDAFVQCVRLEGVLPRYHGRLSEELLPLLLPFQSPPLPGIMPAFDIVKDIRSGFGSRPVVSPIHAFTFEHPKEAFGHGIIGATAHRAHAADDLMGFQESLVFLRGTLTAPIRVQN